MPSTSTRKRPHRWTPFEHHALLCLICRQMQITGFSTSISGPKPNRPKAAVFDLSKSIRHAHRDVADALNRSLNFANQANDIPVEEVSAMITTLLEERRDAVGYLERCGMGRVTRGMRRVWERGARGGRAGVVGSLVGSESSGERASGGNGHGRVTVAALQIDNGGFAGGSDDQVLDLITDTQDDVDPWGDTIAASFTQAQADPWGEEVMASFANGQGATDAWSLDHVDVSMAGGPDATDPWASWASWASTDSALVNATSSNDPRAGTSSAFISTASSDFINDQAQSMASVTTASNPPPEQDFTGINSERLAMLDANACEDETVQEPICASGGKGENAVELPFNRLAMNNTKETSAREATKDEESEISEEE